MAAHPPRTSRLPESPVCLAGERATARTYLSTLERALADDHWTRRERQALIRRWRIWKLRAEGLDAYFDTYGTFGRMPGSPPPTVTDVTVLTWRRQFPDAHREAQADLRKTRRIR